MFREDLFHRLNVIRLRLPPLRERAEDVPALTRHFLQKSARELGVEAKRISDAALAELMRFDFPGNVRQLENICHWLTVMAPAQMIEAKDLPPEVRGAAMVDTKPASGTASPANEAVSAGVAPVDGADARRGSPVQAAHADAAPDSDWLAAAGADARNRLESGEARVWETLMRRFEAQLIRSALAVTRGRRIEAAQRLGIGRNTITRKIQELGLDD